DASRGLALEPRQDRLEESVADQVGDCLPSAAPRRLQRPRDVDLRGHFLARDVLQGLRGDVDHALPELPREALVAILLRIVGLDVLEQWLDVPVHVAVLDVELREERELTRDDVEFAVSPQEVVHRPHVGVLDLNLRVEVGPLLLRPEVGDHARVSAAHELAADVDLADAFAHLVADVAHAHLGAAEEDAHLRRDGLVDETDVGVQYAEVPHTEEEVLALRRLARRSFGLDRRGLRLALLRWRVDVVHADVADNRLLEVDHLDGGRVLHAPLGGKRPALDGDVLLVRDRLEVVQLDTFERDLGLHAELGLGEKVGVAVDAELAFLEDLGVGAQGGRIDSIPRVHIADVLGDHVDLPEGQRLVRSLVDVRDPAVDDPHPVDLERIDRLERLLPALLVEGRRVFRLLLDVRSVGVELRLLEPEVRDHSTEDQRFPLHARVEPRDMQHRRLRMGVLDEDEVVKGQRRADRMEAQLLDVGGVALQPSVHLALDRS